MTREADAFARWLDVAVRGLPDAAAARARAEFTAHFEDFAAEQVGEGASPEEAEQAALAALGAPNACARGLLDAHLGQRHYRIGALLSIWIIAVIFVVPLLHPMLGMAALSMAERLFFTAAQIALFVPTALALRAFTRLLEWRFGTAELSGSYRLIVVSLFTYLFLDTLTLFLFGYAAQYGNGRSPFAVTTLLEFMITAAAMLAYLVTGFGMLRLTLDLWRIKVSLYGLRLLIMALINLLGFFLIGTGLAIILSNRTVEYVFVAFGNLTHLLLWPVLILLFFRATFQGGGQTVPTRLA